jgi:hypothetical protein
MTGLLGLVSGFSGADRTTIEGAYDHGRIVAWPLRATSSSLYRSSQSKIVRYD